jgi:hypothetical protein
MWDFMEAIKAKVPGSMPTRLAFPEPAAEGFQIVYLTALEPVTLLPLLCVTVSSVLQH